MLCRAFPSATLHTLIRKPGALSPAIESMAIRTSPLQRVPGVLDHYRKLLPLMPLAARSWDVGDVDLVVSLSHCVAKMVRVPGRGPARLLLLHPDAVRLGRPRCLSRLMVRPPGPSRPWPAVAPGSPSGEQDRATSDERVSHFVAISETIRDRISRCYGRESRVIQPPVDADFYFPDGQVDVRISTSVVSALVPYKRGRSGGRGLHRLRAGS